ncbi:MAG: hypothetical protein EA398_01345 [Deltaproteobacteria bacterium]|nr:MAG: hypothetical protein EA398_01345 [Deltaproteobacteria bacterium]
MPADRAGSLQVRACGSTTGLDLTFPPFRHPLQSAGILPHVQFRNELGACNHHADAEKRC